MKSLQEFKTLTEEEKKDYSKFDALVRAGLGNKAQIQRLHQILDKMGDERPSFNNADKAIIQNIFNKMIDLITNNPQINRQARRAVKEDLSEGIIDTEDYKIGKSGRKVRAHRIEIGDKEVLPKDNIKEQSLSEEIHNDPPFILLLKRTAVRLYPNNIKVGVYHSQRLNKNFAIPFMQTNVGDVQTEQHIVFRDGNSVILDEETALAFQKISENLNNENRAKFFEMIYESEESFNKAKEFAINKLQ